MSDTARLSSIRARLDAIEPGQWMLAADGEGQLIEARGPMGELWPLLRFHAGASSDEMQFVADAPETVRFLLGLVDRAIRASRAASQASPAGAPAGRGDGPDARSGLRPAAGHGALPRPSGVPDGYADEPAREAMNAKNYAAEAAMLCGKPAFKKFLIECHGLESPASDDRTAQKLRSVLGVTSRAAINEDDAVRDRWKALRGDYYAWKRVGR